MIAAGFVVETTDSTVRLSITPHALKVLREKVALIDSVDSLLDGRGPFFTLVGKAPRARHQAEVTFKEALEIFLENGSDTITITEVTAAFTTIADAA